MLPLAVTATKLERLKRVWAHARLRQQIRSDVPSSVVILGVPEVQGSRRIYLGENLFLYRDLYFETQGDGEIHVGNNVVLSRGVHLVSFSRLEIGDNSLVGEYSSIRDANHSIGDGSLVRNSGHSSRPIRIGRNTWIGRGVSVLSGVEIGDDCVIGANAVVTRNVLSGEVVAGVPARPLKQVAL